jgi:hypothetical protein
MTHLKAKADHRNKFEFCFKKCGGSSVKVKDEKAFDFETLLYVLIKIWISLKAND